MVSTDFELGYVNFEISLRYLWPASKMAPSDPHPGTHTLYLHPCVFPPPPSPIVLGLLSDQLNMEEVLVNQCQDEALKDIATYVLAALARSHHLWKSTAMSQSILGRGPCGQEFRAPANSPVSELGSGSP